MDELKLKLSTRFMKSIVTKLISKAIYSKLGYKIDIQLNEIEIENIDGKVYLHVNADAEVDKEEFVKIVKDVGLN